MIYPKSVWVHLAVIAVLELLSCSETRRIYVHDADCPRQPALASQRKCLKKCTTDLDCNGKKKECKCDGPCGKSCVNPLLRCDTLKTIFNGKIEISPYNKFGAKALYTCDEGYILSGSPERTCQGDKYWSGEAPTCETEGKCRDPPIVPHATHDGPPGRHVFALGTQLTYTCASGYSIDGFFRAMCLGEGRWVGPKMTCSPRRCSHPGDIRHGHRSGNVFVYPNRVTYSCSEGYELVGKPYRVCQANQQWTGTLPICKAVTCPRLGRPANGYMHGTTFTYGGIVKFSCSPGFTLIGSPERKCLQDGRWSGEDATCALVDCGLPSHFYNGYIQGNYTTHGSTINYLCFPRTSFIGVSKFAICQDNGNWSHPPPKCLSNCKVPQIENGNATTNHIWVNDSSTITFQCESGKHRFELDDSRPSVCQNGTWSVIPKCVPAPCNQRPPEIRYGIYRFLTTQHGAKAKYKCNPGYKLEGDQYAQCQYGKWHMDERAKCTEQYCKYPGEIEDGRVMIVGVIGKYEYRHYVRRIGHNDNIAYVCERGFTRKGPEAATCVNGVWSPAGLPTCEPGNHTDFLYMFRGKRSVGDQHGVVSVSPNDKAELIPDVCIVPRVKGARIRGHRRGDLISNEQTINVKCRREFELEIGANNPLCHNGTWLNMPVCKIKYCKWPGTIENGVILLVGIIGKYEYRKYVRQIGDNTTIDYVCNKGFSRVGPAFAVCWKGSWTPNKRAQCVEPGSVTTIQYDTEETDNSRSAQYDLVGEKSCKSPANLEHGKIFVYDVDGERLEHVTRSVFGNNATIEFECDEGFTRIGPANTECKNNRWGPRISTQCVNVTTTPIFQNIPVETSYSVTVDERKQGCIVPQIRRGDVRNETGHGLDLVIPQGNKVEHMSVARLVCRTGKMVNQPDLLRCLDGQWDHIPHCRIGTGGKRERGKHRRRGLI